MDRFPDSSFSVGLQAGRLEGVSVPDLLWALCRERRTGVVHFRRKQVEKKVYLDQGRIIFTASNRRDDRLGEQLLRKGRISLAQLEAAIAEIDDGKRIGTALVEQESLTPEHLVDAVLTQVKRIFLELFGWEEGEYHFAEGPLPTEELITLNMSTGELLLSGIRGIRSFARIRCSVGTPRTMYRLRHDWRESLDGVRLSEGEELLVVRLEQGDESVEGLCREVFLSNFEIYQTLWGLKVLGVVEEKVSLAESGDAEWQGRLAGTHFAAVLVGVARRGETGILHVSRRMRERTFHFQDGRCVFATSNDPDDGLVAYLLRRGVISLNDREETAKRLLSNKRVGTILRELGVIDARDLEEMVRQQLSDIVYDTFDWEEGDFAFYPGSLPSIEDITLDVSMGSLIAEGIRRVPSWARVMEGCGGMEHSLSLSPSYLDVLDGLDAGAEEWKVVNALRDPCPAREVAAAVDMPDFRVCQILWTLRVLQAIELTPLGEAVVVQSQSPAETISVDVVDLDRPADETPVREPSPEYSADELDDSDEFDEDRPPADETDRGEYVAADSDEPGGDEGIEVVEEDTAVSEIDVAHTEDPVDEVDSSTNFEEEDHTIDVVADEADDEIEDVDVEVVEPGYDEEPVAAAADSSEDPDDEKPLLDLEESSRTMRLSRDDVEAAIRNAPYDEADPLDSWEPPENLDHTISRFNAIQRIVYSTVRSEVGAGAANFIRACIDEDQPNPIEGTELQSDGTWDIEGLRRQVLENRIEDPWELYRQLIDRELDVLRSHVGEAKVVELQRRVEQVSETYAS